MDCDLAQVPPAPLPSTNTCFPHLVFEKTRWGGLNMSFGRGMTGCPAFSFTKQEGKPLLAGRRKHVRDKREAWRSPSQEGSPHLSGGLWARGPASNAASHSQRPRLQPQLTAPPSSHRTQRGSGMAEPQRPQPSRLHQASLLAG